MYTLKISLLTLFFILTEFAVIGPAQETTTSAPCSQGKTQHHGFTDRYIATLIRLNWHAAYAYCEQNGWNLLRIASAEDQFELETFLNFFNIENETFWTSGSNLINSHSYHWAYNGPNFDFVNWAPGQPDNFMGREHCVRIIEDFSQWDDYPCDKHLHFICQRY